MTTLFFFFSFFSIRLLSTTLNQIGYILITLLYKSDPQRIKLNPGYVAFVYQTPPDVIFTSIK